MNTNSEIGFVLRRNKGILFASTVTGILVVGLHWLLVLLKSGYWVREPILVLGAVLILGFMAKWDRDSLGLRMPPAKDLRHLVKIALIIGAIVALFGICVFAVFRLFGIEFDARIFTHRSQLLPWLIGGCILAPVFEEGIYRFALCTPLAASLGKWPAIIVGGAAFSAVHFIYGNPGPDNFIAGFLLAWVYLKTRSIFIPMILHSLGNLCVFLFQVICYYPDA